MAARRFIKRPGGGERRGGTTLARSAGAAEFLKAEEPARLGVPSGRAVARSGRLRGGILAGSGDLVEVCGGGGLGETWFCAGARSFERRGVNYF